MAQCPICGTSGSNPLRPLPGLGDSVGFGCPRCGEFYLSGTSAALLQHDIAKGTLNASRLSHTLRVRFDATNKPRIMAESDLEPYRKDLSYIYPQEQLDNLILWIGSNQGPPHAWAVATEAQLAACIGSAIKFGDPVERELDWIRREYLGKSFYSCRPTGNGSMMGYQLKPEGWTYFHELRRRTLHSKNAFMAMKFNEKQLDDVLTACFNPLPRVRALRYVR